MNFIILEGEQNIKKRNAQTHKAADNVTLLKISFDSFSTKNKKNSIYKAIFNNYPPRMISTGYFKDRKTDPNVSFILEHTYRYIIILNYLLLFNIKDLIIFINCNAFS